MKLYVASDAFETFDVIVATKKAEDNYVTLSVFEYATGVKKLTIDKKYAPFVRKLFLNLSECGSGSFRTLVSSKVLFGKS